MAVSCVAAHMGSATVAGVTAIAVRPAAVTVAGAAPATPEAAAVTVTAPGACPVSTPVPETEARAGLLDVQAACAERSDERPSDQVPVAVSWRETPDGTEIGAGPTTTAVRVGLLLLPLHPDARRASVVVTARDARRALSEFMRPPVR